MKNDSKFIKSIIGKLLQKVESQVYHDVDDKIAPLIAAKIIADKEGQFLFLVPDSLMASEFAKSVEIWLKVLGIDHAIKLVPELGDAKNYLPDNEAARLKIMFDAVTVKKSSFVASVAACFSPVISSEKFLAGYLELKRGMKLNFDFLVNKLAKMDYDNEYQVENYCEFSVRGGIIDVYSPLFDLPARIEFFGNEIEEIRLFSPVTQKSIEKINYYSIIGRDTMLGKTSNHTFFDYLQKPQIIFLFPEQCKNAFEHIEPFLQAKKHHKIFDDDYERSERLYIMDVAESARIKDKNSYGVLPLILHSPEAMKEEVYRQSKEIFLQPAAQQVRIWLKEDYEIFFTVSNQESHDYLSRWLNDNDIFFDKKQIIEIQIPYGLIIPEKRIVIITEKELFLNLYTKKCPKKISKKEMGIGIDVISEYNFEFDIGNHVVHVAYGIGLFYGIKELEVAGNLREVLEIEYDNDVKIYVPIWQANLVSRYIGSKKTIPKLSKIGGQGWIKTKLSAIKSAQNMAAEMLRIQAVRMACGGHAFPEDDVEQKMFDSEFLYEETIDQTRVIKEVKHDMMRASPMDRLICGDVGYGKTEIAMRAAFKAVMAGKQVAILVPTTILAQQHYLTFQERFVGYPIIIEMLSRFKTNVEQKEILKNLKNGAIDIIIGTHRLLQNDIYFSALGLLIVDEEQRFGLIHKEKLKRLRATVDILTMSATPIPRTLHLSMAGIKDLSTLTVAPNERLPVETTVCEYDEELIKNAITKEIERGGQVFFVHNRVKTIDVKHEQLKKILPNIRFNIGHGQMAEHQLENVMSQFITGNIDVLICTTIIESGIDIPNANTIIIERADKFGLAELYQLRGRVGRWSKQAYAYLLLPKHSVVTGDARARINAIRKYTHLGAGFKVAIKDLEIRGAGNILGTQQSGYINAIGFDLYCQLLKASVAKLKGKKEPIFIPTVDINFDFLDFGLKARPSRITAGFSQKYIPSERLRIDFYRKLCFASSLQEIDDIKIEMEDRFGKLPKEALNFLNVMKVKVNVAKAGYFSIKTHHGHVFIEGEGKVFLMNGKIPELKGKTPEKKLQYLLEMQI